MQGQRSHLAQAKKCHKRWQADLNTTHILPQNLSEGHSKDNDQTAGIGERPATDRDLNADWHVDKPNFPELPVDEALVLDEGQEECRHDEDDSESTPSFNARWCKAYPQAGRGLRRELTMFESLRNAQVAKGESIWGMFSDESDWDFGKWIIKSETTQGSTNELLEMKKVSKKVVAEYRTY
jgi:hypothetical protein